MPGQHVVLDSLSRPGLVIRVEPAKAYFKWDGPGSYWTKKHASGQPFEASGLLDIYTTDA
jgi:hypothetical protein